MAVIKTHPNVAAFLDTLAFSEGTATHPLTRNNGYDVIVTGIDGKPEIFTDYRDHPFAGGRPAKVFNRRGEKSTASGRYQQLYLFWPHYKKQLALPDFSPASQDRLAIQLIQSAARWKTCSKGASSAPFPVVAISGLHCRVLDTVSVSTASTSWSQCGARPEAYPHENSHYPAGAGRCGSAVDATR